MCLYVSVYFQLPSFVFFLFFSGACCWDALLNIQQEEPSCSNRNKKTCLCYSTSLATKNLHFQLLVSFFLYWLPFAFCAADHFLFYRVLLSIAPYSLIWFCLHFFFIIFPLQVAAVNSCTAQKSCGVFLYWTVLLFFFPYSCVVFHHQSFLMRSDQRGCFNSKKAGTALPQGER